MKVPEKFFPRIVKKLLEMKLLKRSDLPRLDKALVKLKGDIIDALIFLGVPRDKIFQVISEITELPAVDLKSISLQTLVELNQHLPLATIKRYNCLVVGNHPQYGYLICTTTPDDPLFRENLNRIFPKYTFVYSSTSDLLELVKAYLTYRQKEAEKQITEAQLLLQSDEFFNEELYKHVITERRREIAIELPLEKGSETISVSEPIKETPPAPKEAERSLSQIIQKEFVVICSPGVNLPELIDAFAESGCHAIKVHFNLEHPASKARFGSLKEELPKIVEPLKRAKDRGLFLGVVPFETWDEKVIEEVDFILKRSQLRFDFIDTFIEVFPPRVLSYEWMEKMIAIKSPEISPLILEEIWERFKDKKLIGIEVATIPKEMYGKPLTLGLLISKYYFSYLTQISQEIPLLFPTQLYVHPDDLQTLADMGFRGIVIGTVVTSLDPDKAYKVASEFVRRAKEIRLKGEQREEVMLDEI